MANGVTNNYGVNPYSSVYSNYSNYAAAEKTSSTGAAQTTSADNAASTNTDGAAVAVVKSNTSKYQADFEKIDSLYSTQKSYMQGLQSIVNQVKYQSSGVTMLNSLPQSSANQSAGKNNLYNLAGMSKMDAFSGMKDYFSLFVKNKDGSFSVDLSGIAPKDRQTLISKAQEDVSENGYFGVKQTSQRILEFAKAITGGDPEKMENMKKVVDKAFKQVGGIFGGYNNLPDISKKTYDAVMQGFDEWTASMGVGTQAQQPA